MLLVKSDDGEKDSNCSILSGSTCKIVCMRGRLCGGI